MIKCRAAQFTRPHIKRLFVFRSTLTRAMNLYSDKTKWQTSSLFRTQQSVRGFDANISLHHRFMCVCVYIKTANKIYSIRSLIFSRKVGNNFHTWRSGNNRVFFFFVITDILF
jgi:hypothetical protein